MVQFKWLRRKEFKFYCETSLNAINGRLLTFPRRQVHLEGAEQGLFLSRDQRSLYNVDRLTGRPWWTKDSTTYGPFFDLLESQWQVIREEGVGLLSLSKPEGFTDEAENLRDTGDWKQFELFARGKKNNRHCDKVAMRSMTTGTRSGIPVYFSFYFKRTLIQFRFPGRVP